MTHLYSGMSTITRQQGYRRLGVIESAYYYDDMMAEIIADGKHLPPELIRLILKIKGSDKIALVTDSLALAGTDVTHGFMNATEFIIEDGVCKLMDRSAFAGSIATTDRCLRVLCKDYGISICDASKMLSLAPAKLHKIDKDYGSIEVGKIADLVITDCNYNIESVILDGIIKKF